MLLPPLAIFSSRVDFIQRIILCVNICNLSSVCPKSKATGSSDLLSNKKFLIERHVRLPIKITVRSKELPRKILLGHKRLPVNTWVDSLPRIAPRPVNRSGILKNVDIHARFFFVYHSSIIPHEEDESKIEK